MRPAAPTAADCSRALWLLGLTPPVDAEELARAWRARVRRSHPDRHAGSESRAAAATLVTTAVNDARRVVADWIESGREWPMPDGVRARAATAAVPRRPAPEPRVRAVCTRTGLRAGDAVRVLPYGDQLRTVAGTDVHGGRVWVLFTDGASEAAPRVRLAAYSCPVCGQCEGPEDETMRVRPCPECLADLHRLERRASDAPRVRSAIEARAELGRSAALSMTSPALAQRADERRRWARRLRGAGEDDLRAALLGAFTRAYDRWAEEAA
jgi:hypothetical protein